jgi:hypothetical protein
MRDDLDTSPIRSACAHLMTSPVNSNSAAFAGSTSRGKIIMPRHPSRAPLDENLAELRPPDAIRISANKLSSIPHPTATPFTAAMIGRSQSMIAAAAGVRRGRTEDSRACDCSRLGPVIICLTSSPEQNAGSAPVTTTVRTSLSLWICRNTVSRSA